MQSLLGGQTREFAGLFLLIAATAAIGEFAWRRYFSTLGYDGRATLATFGVAAGQLVSGGLSGIAIGAIYLAVYTATPFRQPLEAWWSWGLLFLLVEFCYYWQHRMSHEVRWLWATHSVHHSPNELTLPAASRLGWTGLISGLWVFFLPLAAMGFNPAAIALLITLNLRFQYFLHTDLIGRLGPLEGVSNTPSAHRVHHASNPAYIDRNYGGVLIVFDRLFGTYAAERPEETCRYGLVMPQTSNNPLVIVTAEWRKLVGDMVRSGSPWAALKIAAGYPGARPVIILPDALAVTA